MTQQAVADAKGLIFDVDTFAVHDGPGIRMAVYFKGCPLRCQWCHSPESQAPRPELTFVADRCILCGACEQTCPNAVHAIGSAGHVIRWELCEATGECADHCPSGALTMKGEEVSAEAIEEKAARLKPFFDRSSGGVTLTGGEVTMQPDFAAAILHGCRTRGIHTAIETCGACDWSSLQRLAHLSDLILFDLKLIDDTLHQQWTGGSNQQILDNARRLHGRNVIVRLPLIPGVTDTMTNVSAVAHFMREAGLPRLQLLPYNESAAAKYEWLGRRYFITAPTPSPAQNELLLATARSAGLAAEIA